MKGTFSQDKHQHQLTTCDRGNKTNTKTSILHDVALRIYILFHSLLQTYSSSQFPTLLIIEFLKILILIQCLLCTRHSICLLYAYLLRKQIIQEKAEPTGLANEGTGPTSEVDGVLTCGAKQRERGTKTARPELALAKQEETVMNLLTAEAECL